MTYPQARWKFEHSADGGFTLVIWTQPDGSQYQVQPLRFPMTGEEAWGLTSGVDRVQAWAAQSEEGTFTDPTVAPNRVRQQLSITGYVVTCPDLETHTRLVQATPWANWVEEVPPPEPGKVSWFVDVFDADQAQFLAAADVHKAVLTPASYGKPEEPVG